VPAPLADLIGDLLKKTPAERPANMRAVAERLMAYVSRMTTVPGPGSFSAANAIAATAMPASPMTASQPPAPGSPARTTFGGAAGEVEAERPPRGKGPLVAAALLLLGGGAAAFALTRTPAKPETPVAAAAAPPPTVAPPSAAPMPPPPPAAPTPAEAPPPPTAVAEVRTGKEKESGRKGRHAASGESAPAAPIEPAAPSSSATPSAEAEHHAPAAAEPSGSLYGSWEGPWVDTAHNQKGRLSISVRPDGVASGWMFNTSANQSYRMLGRMSPAGGLDLGCQCPPGQMFYARGAVHVDGSDLKGSLALSSPRGPFGETRLTLRRK
jgi:outer membrane biosynthesis protein TonB